MKSILVVAALGAAGALGPVESTNSRAEAPALSAANVREVARIRSHFDSVLVELKNVDARFDATQLARRSALVETLRGYRNRGVFPHNYDFTTPTPYFIDRKTGTLCAVAFLMESTGRRDMVDRIAAAKNNVWVAELANDREVGAWLSRNGLTLAEAARIQLPYVGGPTPPAPPPPPSLARYNRNATIAGIASIGTTLLSIDGDPAKAGKRYAVGALVGVVAIALGRPGSDVRPDQGPRSLTVLAGATSLGIAALRQVQRDRFLNRRANQTAIDIQPTANVSERSAGMTVALRF